MLYGFRRFARLVFKSYFAPHKKYAPLTLRRFLLLTILVPFLLFGQSFHWLGFLLDDVFFRSYRKIKIKAPVFIGGIPRSGTTLLQRVLCEDTDNFTCPRLWESAVAPSIAEWKFWTLIGRIDRALGSFGRRLIERVEARLLRELNKIHPSSLFKHEEDEMYFLPIFSTAILIYLFPFPEELEYLARFDEEASPREKVYVMAHYRRCIQRHLYTHGRDKHFLAKNILTTPKIEALRATFPDARVICSVRNPYHSVPSILSLSAYYWRQFANAGDAEDFQERFLDIAKHLYLHPMRKLPMWPPEQYSVVRYEELKADLEGTVKSIYAKLGLPVSASFSAKLERERRQASVYRSRHVYSMEDFGLTPERIRTEFAEVFDYYGFSTDDF